MISLRKGAARGHTHHDWLESWHSFSFGEYHDPANVRFGALRVINEDIVLPGAGFDTHGHRDMEILTYVLSGTLRHHDSMGHSGDIRHGEIQLMRAGSGLTHSEFNPSPDEPLHLLQIWILPDVHGLAPGYWQRSVAVENKRGQWCLLVSPDAAEGSLQIRQDVRVCAAMLDGASTSYTFGPGRRGYLHVARGSLIANGIELVAGDALAIEDETGIELHGGKDAEVLLFDL